MKVQCFFLTVFVAKLLFVNARIHGGPRGRFANANATRTPAFQHHVVAHLAHYSYHPPSYISYLCRFCKAPTAYPVYHGPLPNYIYKLCESRSKYSYLLTGLALYNLGRSSSDQSSQTYTLHPGEACSIQVVGKAIFEETAFPCFMMSTFMDRASDSDPFHNRSVHIVRSQINVKPYVNTSGAPILLNHSEDCIIWHNISSFKERYHIPCPLLHEYALTMKPAGVPVYIWLPMTLASVIAIYIFCYSCCKKNKKFKGEQFDLINPRGSVHFVNYYANSQ